MKLSISLCFFIIVFIVSTSQLFLFFFSFSLVLSFIRFVIPFVVLIVRCIIEFLIGIFHCSHYLGRVRHFHFSYLRPTLGLDFFYSSSITFIVAIITFHFQFVHIIRFHRSIEFLIKIFHRSIIRVHRIEVLRNAEVTRSRWSSIGRFAGSFTSYLLSGGNVSSVHRLNVYSNDPTFSSFAPFDYMERTLRKF